MTEDLSTHPDTPLDSSTETILLETPRIVDMATGEIIYSDNDPGDSSEIEALYLKYFRELGRLAYLLTNDLQEAEDVVAEIFLKLTERYDVRNLEDPLAFLRAAVVNGSRSVLRHRAVQAKTLPKLLPGSLGDSTYESVAGAADASAIVRALHKLPLRQRQVIVLRYYADLNERETAEAMGIKEGSVKSHMARGVAALRHILAPYLQEFM